MSAKTIIPNMAGDQYQQFLARKAIIDPMTGLQGKRKLPKQMFQIQRDVTGWMIRRGRAALLSGTGTGKTIMELGWGDEIRKETKRPIMQFAPLAVSAQIVREANKFGIPARLVTSNLDCDPDYLCIANYQKMHHFRMADFGGCTLDESGILKSVDGHFRNLLIDQCKDIPFRIAATATPAPNDFMEIGNHAEFLGIMSYTDMLATFFIHDGGDTQKWRLKGHAEQEFWKWFASWAVMYRMPSDLGYSDEGYELPPLLYHQHTVAVEHDPVATGFLIPMQAQSLSERLTARRTSINERIAKAVEITPMDRPFVWWCNLNAEAEVLAKQIGATNLHGSLSEDEKERIILDFCEGRIQRLVTKGSIMAFGVNAQICADTGFVGLNDSFEQFYQAIRRFWRFGQTKTVNCHIIAAETEGAVVANIRRKEADADRMMAAMIMHMKDLSSEAVRGQVRDTPAYNPTLPMIVPEWLK